LFLIVVVIRPIDCRWPEFTIGKSLSNGVKMLGIVNFLFLWIFTIRSFWFLGFFFFRKCNKNLMDNIPNSREKPKATSQKSQS